MVGLALFTVLVKFFVKMYFRLYERKASLLMAGSRYIVHPRSHLDGLKIFHVNALKRADLPKRASKSKLRKHDEVCLGQHSFG